MKEKFYYIYKITNLLNEQFYIGMHQTKNLNDGYFGSGLRLKNSITKYGIENFQKEILEFLSSRDEMIQREKELVTEDLIKSEFCLNLKPGGHGGYGIDISRKGGQKHGLKRKLENDPIFRDYFSKQKSEKNRILHKQGILKINPYMFQGKKHTEKTLNQMRGKTHQQKEGNSQFGTCWITKENENKKIKKEELNTYLFQGWIKGRKMKQSA